MTIDEMIRCLRSRRQLERWIEFGAALLAEDVDDRRVRERSRIAAERSFEEEQLRAAGLPLEAARQSRCL